MIIAQRRYNKMILRRQCCCYPRIVSAITAAVLVVCCCLPDCTFAQNARSPSQVHDTLDSYSLSDNFSTENFFQDVADSEVGLCLNLTQDNDVVVNTSLVAVNVHRGNLATIIADTPTFPSCHNCSGSPVLELSLASLPGDVTCLTLTRFASDVGDLGQNRSRLSDILCVSLYDPGNLRGVNLTQSDSVLFEIPVNDDIPESSYSFQCHSLDPVSWQWRDTCWTNQTMVTRDGTKFVQCRCSTLGCVAVFNSTNTTIENNDDNENNNENNNDDQAQNNDNGGSQSNNGTIPDVVPSTLLSLTLDAPCAHYLSDPVIKASFLNTTRYTIAAALEINVLNISNLEAGCGSIIVNFTVASEDDETLNETVSRLGSLVSTDGFQIISEGLEVHPMSVKSFGGLSPVGPITWYKTSRQPSAPAQPASIARQVLERAGSQFSSGNLSSKNFVQEVSDSENDLCVNLTEQNEDSALVNTSLVALHVQRRNLASIVAHTLTFPSCHNCSGPPVLELSFANTSLSNDVICLTLTRFASDVGDLGQNRSRLSDILCVSLYDPANLTVMNIGRNDSVHLEIPRNNIPGNSPHGFKCHSLDPVSWQWRDTCWTNETMVTRDGTKFIQCRCSTLGCVAVFNKSEENTENDGAPVSTTRFSLTLDAPCSRYLSNATIKADFLNTTRYAIASCLDTSASNIINFEASCGSIVLNFTLLSPNVTNEALNESIFSFGDKVAKDLFRITVNNVNIYPYNVRSFGETIPGDYIFVSGYYYRKYATQPPSTTRKIESLEVDYAPLMITVAGIVFAVVFCVCATCISHSWYLRKKKYTQFNSNKRDLTKKAPVVEIQEEEEIVDEFPMTYTTRQQVNEAELTKYHWARTSFVNAQTDVSAFVTSQPGPCLMLDSSSDEEPGEEQAASERPSTASRPGSSLAESGGEWEGSEASGLETGGRESEVGGNEEGSQEMRREGEMDGGEEREDEGIEENEGREMDDTGEHRSDAEEHTGQDGDETRESDGEGRESREHEEHEEDNEEHEDNNGHEENNDEDESNHGEHKDNGEDGDNGDEHDDNEESAGTGSRAESARAASRISQVMAPASGMPEPSL